MKQIFTPNDLLRYLYKEMDFAEEKAIEQQIEKDASFALEYHSLQEGITLLKKAEMNPGSSLLLDLKQRLHLNIEEHSM